MNLTLSVDVVVGFTYSLGQVWRWMRLLFFFLSSNDNINQLPYGDNLCTEGAHVVLLAGTEQEVKVTKRNLGMENFLIN